MDSMGCRYFCTILGCFWGIVGLNASPPKNIDWFKGSVEEAFKAARTSGRPLFLYWGAVWCPPCTKMKKTVFSRPLFQKKMKGFVPVYFDGDQDRAQIWGEKLKAKGYPTLMIFNAEGRELMRLPVNASVERYMELLDMALKNNVKSIAQILKSVTTLPASKISRGDWSMLAGHAWFQDTALGQSHKEKLETLKSLYQKIPVAYKRERYRLFLLYLSGAGERLDNVQEYTAFLDKLLQDRDFIDKNFTDVILMLPPIVRKLYQGRYSNEREKVERRLLDLSAGRVGTAEEKLLGLYPTLVFKKENLSASFKSKLLGVVKEIDKSVNDAEGRQDIMSTSIGLLVEAGLMDEAREYAFKELQKSSSPFYFMSILSNIEEKKGNARAALEWSRKAWNSSRGASTRFLWGRMYLLKILSLNPRNGRVVVATFKKVFDEIRKREDAFSGRNQESFVLLGKAVAKWQDKKGRKDLWGHIRKNCKGTCLEKMRKWGFVPR